MARLGTLLLALGVCAIGYGLLWQFGLAPGSRVTVPEPVALQRAGGESREVSAPVAPTLTLTPLPTAFATVTAVPAVVPTVSPVEGIRAGTPVPQPTLPPSGGYAVRLAIPAIKVDTVVEQGGIVQHANGDSVWETLPFVAVHYGDRTSKLGVAGNAVIAGHVVTLSEGNVFRFLYQLDLGDQIDVWDELAREHAFQVETVKLVPPSDTSVMDPTPDETLTLITCGGTFDSATREFSDRLIVIAKPR